MAASITISAPLNISSLLSVWLLTGMYLKESLSGVGKSSHHTPTCHTYAQPLRNPCSIATHHMAVVLGDSNSAIPSSGLDVVPDA